MGFTYIDIQILYINFYSKYSIQYLGNYGRSRLLKVRTHELLEIEVGEGVSISKLEKLLELWVRKDDTTIILVLEVILADVGSHLLGDISASHEGATITTKEIGKLVADLGWLYEARRSTVALVLVLLGVDLVKNAKLLGNILLKSTDLSTKSGKVGTELMKRLV